METAMRKTKREIIGAKASGDDDMFTAKSILLRRQKEEYANFSKAAGLLTQNERTQVYGFDRSTAQKAAWKARKAHKPLDNGGGNNVINYAKATDIFNDYGAPKNAVITSEQIFENLKSSKIGKEYLEVAENLPERIRLDYDTYRPDLYGENQGNSIVIYMRSNLSAERAARTIIHECTHYRYGIGESQWSECVCVANELMHKYNREYLTIAEKRRIIKVVKDVYGNLNWRKGGVINGRRKSH